MKKKSIKNIMKTENQFQENRIIVLTFGTFDLLHPGHEYYLNTAKKYGNFLVTIIGTDKNVEKIKGKKPINNQNIRKENLEKLNISNLVEIGDEENQLKWIDIFKPQVICLGYDQEGFSFKLKDFADIRIIRLNPFNEKEYKSSIISKNLLL